MEDPYNIEEQLEHYKKREQEVAKIQRTAQITSPSSVVLCLIEYGDDCKYIRFLLEAIQKLQKDKEEQ